MGWGCFFPHLVTNIYNYHHTHTQTFSIIGIFKVKLKKKQQTFYPILTLYIFDNFIVTKKNEEEKKLI